MLNRFYDEGSAEPDMSCPGSMEEPELWAPMYTTSLTPGLGALYFDDEKKLIVPGVWAGLSIFISLIAFLQLTLAPIGRKMNKQPAAHVGRTRFWAWLTATCSVAAVAVLGAAFAVTAQTSELAMLFGLVPWAKYSAWLGLLAGVLGLVTLVLVIKGRSKHRIPAGTLLGLVLTAAAAIGLSSFMYFWDLAPF
jgi:hypothetical protein